MDAIVEAWRRERPDLDPSAKQVTGRVIRLAGLLQDAYARPFAALGLNSGDYGVLVSLRRAGSPYQLTPTDLARRQMMTSGGMTSAIDRLERKGLVARTPNPNDRRGSLVGLSEEGLRTVDEAMGLHVAEEHRLLEGLDEAERVQLESLLRRLLVSIDT